MATAHLLTIEPHAAPPHHPPSEPTLSEPVHLPGDNYLPGPTLFPGELIAGYHAQSSEYNADTWAAYVLKETSKFPTGSVAFSCSGAYCISSRTTLPGIHRYAQASTLEVQEEDIGLVLPTAVDLSTRALSSRRHLPLVSQEPVHTSNPPSSPPYNPNDTSQLS